MLGGIVQRNDAIKVGAPVRNVTHEHQGYAHEHVPDHARDRGALVLGKDVKLLRKLARHVALERHAVADPEAVEDGEQQQRIVGGLPERLRLLDQETRLLERCFGLGRCMALGVDQRVREIDLQLDLLAAERGCAWQRRDLAKRSRELLGGFLQRRARQRPPSGLAPKSRGFLDQARLRCNDAPAVPAGFRRCRRIAFEGLGDAGVKRAPRLAQQRAVGRVLHQSMIEQIGRIRRRALPEQQTGRQRDGPAPMPSSASGLRATAASSAMRELAADRRADLRHLLGGAEPVEAAPSMMRAGLPGPPTRATEPRRRSAAPRPRSPPPAPPSSSPPRTAECRRCAQ